MISTKQPFEHRRFDARQAVGKHRRSNAAATEKLSRPLSAALFSDEALMVLLKCGFALAWDELYERYQSPVREYLRKSLDWHNCEDALQETFMRVRSGAPTFDGRSFRPWLFTIAHNQACNIFRLRSRRRETSYDDQVATIDRQFGFDKGYVTPPAVWIGRQRPGAIDGGVIDRETEAVVRALAKLADVDQLSIFMGGVGDFFLKEIAVLLMVPSGTIGVHWHRFRKRSGEQRLRILADAARAADGEDLRQALLQQWRRLCATPLGRRTRGRARAMHLLPQWSLIDKRLADRDYWVADDSPSTRRDRRR